MADEYEIGYGRPPKRTRFKKGESGNPNGRPKGAKNLKTHLIEEMNEKILVREGGHSRKIPKQRALVKTLFNGTLKGESKTANTLVNLIFRLVDPAYEAKPPSLSLNAEERAVLETLKSRLLEDAYSDPEAPDNANDANSKP